MKSKNDLLREYDALEDAIEQAATTEVWELADWLAENVPNEGRGRPVNGVRPPFTLADLADRRGRSRRWLSDMRKVAEKVPSAERLPGVTVSVYTEVLRKHGWDVAAANAALTGKGTRRRDHRIPESDEAITEMIRQRPDVIAKVPEVVAQALKSPETTEKIVRSMGPKASRQLDEIEHRVTMERLEAKQAERRSEPKAPTVREILGEDAKPIKVIEEIAEPWLDEHLTRAWRQSRVLRAHVEHWGLVLGAMSVDEALEMAEKAEHNIADVRAALQERKRDMTAEEAARKPEVK